MGLIPAHAGKTVGQYTRRTGVPAHPRSRGENADSIRSIRPVGGSSPLTRGKHNSHNCRPDRHRLIPAHAGKTFDAACHVVHRAAHPRSRGENNCPTDGTSPFSGSSPLTRGKRRHRRRRPSDTRLIPAHAGKTPPRPMRSAAEQAHPRSRGENSAARSVSSVPIGSSPLTRGKRFELQESREDTGLIPAHAGKTAESARPACRAPAHPRSRGENLVLAAFRDEHDGSSPLTRGKPP